MLEIKEFHDLIALNKALDFIRFECNQPGVGFISGSPLIVDMHMRLIDILREEYKKQNIIIPDDFGFIEDHVNFLGSIIANVKTIDGWKHIPENNKIGHINTLVKPYKIKEKTIDFLMDL